MEFSRLRTLRELALRSTMAAVAEAVGISPSAVSQQMAQLEDELGIKLIERRGRGVLLTPAGRRLVAHAERLIAVLEEAKTDIAQMRRVVSGELRVAAFPSIAAAMIPRAIRTLGQAHPDLLVVLHELNTLEGLAALRAWEADIALIDDLTLAGAVPAANIETQRLCEDELFAMLPPGHGLASRKSLRLEDLSAERWALDTHSTYSDVIIAACARAGFQPTINGRCNGFPAVAAMVEAGCSVSVMPGLRTRSHRGRYSSIRLAPPIGRVISAAYRRGELRNPAIAAFIAQVKVSAGEPQA